MVLECRIVHCLLSFSHMASLVQQLRMDDLLAEDPRRSGRRFTLVVPSNAAWEKAMMDFSKAYNTIVEGQFPQYVNRFKLPIKALLTFVFHRAR